MFILSFSNYSKIKTSNVFHDIENICISNKTLFLYSHEIKHKQFHIISIILSKINSIICYFVILPTVRHKLITSLIADHIQILTTNIFELWKLQLFISKMYMHFLNRQAR